MDIFTSGRLNGNKANQLVANKTVNEISSVLDFID
jgi:hypothetical protein